LEELVVSLADWEVDVVVLVDANAVFEKMDKIKTQIMVILTRVVVLRHLDKGVDRAPSCPLHRRAVQQLGICKNDHEVETKFMGAPKSGVKEIAITLVIFTGR